MRFLNRFITEFTLGQLNNGRQKCNSLCHPLPFQSDSDVTKMMMISFWYVLNTNTVPQKNMARYSFWSYQ